ncbi:MAG: hypothetical protein HKN23_20850 [Verrucomicrobiales bacterium]|nr:hypothetical protein [Verrucomicrobiales bacterium]
MAILRSTDGKFYEVADEQLDDKLIPAEELKNKLGTASTGPAVAGPGVPPQNAGPVSLPGTGQVVIQIFTSDGLEGPTGPAPEGEGNEEEVTAHGWCWRRNCFHNCWRRNCFRNCYR